MLSDAVVNAEDLSLSFHTRRQRVDALDKVSLTIAPGEQLALMGPSGSGKSSLLYCMAGMLRPTAGTLSVGGVSVLELDDRGLADLRRSKIGFVFQAFHLLRSLSALDNVAVPLRLSGTPRDQARARASELLTAVGLENRTRHRPAELSGGEQQRVAVARALANNPAVIFADEPTGNLDSKYATEVMDLIIESAGPATAIVVATHDERVAARMGRVVHLSSGKISLDNGMDAAWTST